MNSIIDEILEMEEFVAVVAGCRNFTDINGLYEVLDVLGVRKRITKLINGGCRGVDSFAAIWARQNGIPCETMYANWNHGYAGGPERNRKMVEKASWLIAFWDGKSSGTGDVIDAARARGIEVTIIHLDDNYNIVWS